jgi:hypothetical protein
MCYFWSSKRPNKMPLASEVITKHIDALQKGPKPHALEKKSIPSCITPFQVPSRSLHTCTPNSLTLIPSTWIGRGWREWATGGRGPCVGGLEEDLEGRAEELDQRSGGAPMVSPLASASTLEWNWLSTWFLTITLLLMPRHRVRARLHISSSLFLSLRPKAEQ